MKDILNILDIKGEMKVKEIYSLLKTNSQEINSEIFTKIKSFKKINDFFNHYSNRTSLLKLLNEVEFNSSKNYEEILSSFDSNIEKYISCLIQIIISLKLILKTQEILKKIFLSTKQFFLKLKNEQQIENIHQENLFFFIENLLDIFLTKKPGSFSSSTTAFKFESSGSINSNNLLHNQNLCDNQFLKPFSSIDIGKTLKILYEEPCTPRFGSKSDKIFENSEKENFQKIHIKKNSTLSLSDEQKINSFNENKDIAIEKPNSIEKNIEYNNSSDSKKYENLLAMINNIYKKCIINSEEKIGLKQLVIAKSKKLENLYNNTYKNKFIDQNILRSEITKLIN